MAEETSQAARDKALDFLIDKTYGTLVECGKAQSLAMTSYLGLVLFSTLLITGGMSVSGEEVEIPPIGIKADKYFAAYVGLMLSAAALYWFYTCLYTETLLVVKLGDIWRERYKGDLVPQPVPANANMRRAWHSTWYLRHPSPFGSHVVSVGGYRPLGWALLAGQWFGGIATIVVPPGLTWILSDVAKYDNRQRNILMFFAAASVLPSALTLAVSLGNRSKAIMRIEGSGRELRPGTPPDSTAAVSTVTPGSDKE